MKINNIKELNDRKFEGYVWLSDKKEPCLLKNETFDFSKYEEGNNPFVMEALLYKNSKSINIHHTGSYKINEIDLNNLPEGAVLEEVEYLPHRLKDKKKGIDVQKVCFKQLWIPEPDENCKVDKDDQGLPVLKMKALVFTGFKPKN